MPRKAKAAAESRSVKPLTTDTAKHKKKAKSAKTKTHHAAGTEDTRKRSDAVGGHEEDKGIGSSDSSYRKSKRQKTTKRNTKLAFDDGMDEDDEGTVGGMSGYESNESGWGSLHASDSEEDLGSWTREDRHKVFADTNHLNEAAAVRDENGEVRFCVEGILSWRRHPRRGHPQFRTMWTGYPVYANTWEPEQNFGDDKDAMNNFWERLGGRPDDCPAPASGEDTPSVHSDTDTEELLAGEDDVGRDARAKIIRQLRKDKVDQRRFWQWAGAKVKAEDNAGGPPPPNGHGGANGRGNYRGRESDADDSDGDEGNSAAAAGKKRKIVIALDDDDSDTDHDSLWNGSRASSQASTSQAVKDKQNSKSSLSSSLQTKSKKQKTAAAANERKTPLSRHTVVALQRLAKPPTSKSQVASSAAPSQIRPSAAAAGPSSPVAAARPPRPASTMSNLLDQALASKPTASAPAAAAAPSVAPGSYRGAHKNRQQIQLLDNAPAIPLSKRQSQAAAAAATTAVANSIRPPPLSGTIQEASDKNAGQDSATAGPSRPVVRPPTSPTQRQSLTGLTKAQAPPRADASPASAPAQENASPVQEPARNGSLSPRTAWRPIGRPASPPQGNVSPSTNRADSSAHPQDVQPPIEPRAARSARPQGTAEPAPTAPSAPTRPTIAAPGVDPRKPPLPRPISTASAAAASLGKSNSNINGPGKAGSPASPTEEFPPRYAAPEQLPPWLRSAHRHTVRNIPGLVASAYAGAGGGGPAAGRPVAESQQQQQHFRPPPWSNSNRSRADYPHHQQHRHQQDRRESRSPNPGATYTSHGSRDGQPPLSPLEQGQISPTDGSGHTTSSSRPSHRANGTSANGNGSAAAAATGALIPSGARSKTSSQSPPLADKTAEIPLPKSFQAVYFPHKDPRKRTG